MSTRIVIALIAAFCPVAIHSQEKLTAAEIVDKAQAAFYSPGSDTKARVVWISSMPMARSGPACSRCSARTFLAGGNSSTFWLVWEISGWIWLRGTG